MPIAFLNIFFTAKDVVLLRIETSERGKEDRNRRRAKPGQDSPEDVDPIFGWSGQNSVPMVRILYRISIWVRSFDLVVRENRNRYH